MKKIVHINTTSGGGAYVAATRWSELANKIYGTHCSTLLTLEGHSTVSNKALSSHIYYRLSAHMNHIIEKAYFLFYQKNKSVRFQFSTPLLGIDISKFKEIREADAIHLHWINKGFFSIETLKKLIALDKPIFWTMHDMWAFTGGCHHSRGCLNFVHSCGDCAQYLASPDTNDLSNQIWSQKKLLINESHIHFIAPSRWLFDLAQQSSLIQENKLSLIPNPIDNEMFKPINKSGLRQKLNLPVEDNLILFIAANISNYYKGFSFFLETMAQVSGDDVTLVLLGQIKSELTLPANMNCIQLGYVNDTHRIVEIYNACDLFVSTSLEENLPNTIIEAMACGLPSAVFDVGGVSDIIDHGVNGYVSDIFDTVNLAKNINSFFAEEKAPEFSKCGIEKVNENFSYKALKSRFIELYQNV